LVAIGVCGLFGTAVLDWFAAGFAATDCLLFGDKRGVVVDLLLVDIEFPGSNGALSVLA
jgi:hypothetical protein